MSLEVSLHVLRERLYVDSDSNPKQVHAHSVLSMGRDLGLFSQFMRLSNLREEDRTEDLLDCPTITTHRFPRGTALEMRGTEFDFVSQDIYGFPLRWAYAEDLATMQVPEPEYEGFTGRNLNQAVKGYLESIFGNTAVVIYPH